MAIPLLLTAGRVLLMSGGRAAAGGAARGAIANTLKQKAIDTAKDKAVSIVKGKVKEKAKRISTKKLLAKTKNFGIGGGKGGRGGGGGGGGGGALALRKSSAIVKSSSGALSKTEDKKPGGALVKSSNIRDEILKELERIKIDVVKIKEISTQKLLNQKEERENDFIASRKKKSEEQEKNLEEKKDTKKKKKLGITAPKVGLFDMIKRFLLNVLIGSLLNILLKNGPMILKMFKEIGEGLTNTWNVLRLGIITLTTVFPKQVKFVAKLTSKIIGPPAKLIGKLLLKAGRIAGNLFKKSGGVIFNLVKGPLTSLVKKVGGEALEQGVKGAAKGAAKLAGKAAGAAGGALSSTARIVKRFKVFSKIFKRVPVVGALIGIGIDLALGEKLDRAIVGAIGATLGGGIGAAIGQGLIPIPIVGAAVGGFVGAGIGDWAAKEIYGNLTGRVAEADKEIPIEGKAYGGRVNIRGGGTRTLSRSTSIQAKPSSSTALSKQTLNKAKGTILKDEESAKRFGTLSSTYGAIPFIGEAMKLGLDISLGEKVTKPRTDAIAESIGSAIGMALKNDEFGVPGFNKRIVGQFSKNLTAWAKKKIFIDVKSQENQFKLLQEKKEEAQPDAGGSPGGDGGDIGPVGPIAGGPMHEKGANIAKELMKLLGIKDYQAAAIVGNLIQESSLVPDRIQGPGMKRGPLKLDGVTGYSYPQWTSIDRQQAFAKYMESKGHDWRTKGATDELATGFVAKEFKGYMSNVFTGTKDAAAASNWVLKNYEKPADQGPREQRERAADSQAVLSKMGGGGVNGVKRHKVPFLAMGGNHQVTSDMGMRNFALSPGMHMGVDISGTRGEPLQAFTDGVVEATGYDGGYGNWVNWIDNKGIGHFYGHMDKKAYVKSGQKIKKGTILGPLGNTGKSSGPHLHWEAATNPTDNGRPKSAVLSRFNPLSKYNKESPFGGSIQPDPSIASSQDTSSPGSPGAASAPSEGVQISDFAANYKVLGDPAAAKGGRGGPGGPGGSRSSTRRTAPGGGTTKPSEGNKKGGNAAILAAAKAAVSQGKRGPASPPCASWVRMVLGMAKHPSANKTTRYSDLDSEKKAWGPNMAASFAGSDMGTVVRSQGALEPGDIVLQKNTFGNFPKGAITHVSIASDKQGKILHQSTTGGAPKESGIFNFAAGVRLGGGGVVGDYGDTSGGGGGGSGGGGGGSSDAPSEAQISDFALNYKVLGDPAIKSTIPNLSQTASYNKSNGMIVLAQTPGGQSAQPVRKNDSGYTPSFVDGVVNSYGMVSRQLISSSMYKI